MSSAENFRGNDGSNEFRNYSFSAGSLKPVIRSFEFFAVRYRRKEGSPVSDFVDSNNRKVYLTEIEYLYLQSIEIPKMKYLSIIITTATWLFLLPTLVTSARTDATLTEQCVSECRSLVLGDSTCQSTKKTFNYQVLC